MLNAKQRKQRLRLKISKPEQNLLIEEKTRLKKKENEHSKNFVYSEKKSKLLNPKKKNKKDSRGNFKKKSMLLQKVSILNIKLSLAMKKLPNNSESNLMTSKKPPKMLHVERVELIN